MNRMIINPPQKQLDLNFRWLIRQDLEQVLRIENRCFEMPWDERTFRMWLSQRNCIGRLAEARNENGHMVILGYTVFLLEGDVKNGEPGSYVLINFAVDPLYQRHGIATALVDKIKSRLDSKRPKIIDEVRESNLPMQLFLRANDFKCVKVIRDAYDCCDDSAYRFEFELKPVSDGDEGKLSAELELVGSV